MESSHPQTDIEHPEHHAGHERTPRQRRRHEKFYRDDVDRSLDDLLRHEDVEEVVAGLRRVPARHKPHTVLLSNRTTVSWTSHIWLSGGHADGTILDWTVDAVETRPGWMCRSPDGCTSARLADRSYCAGHLAKYVAPTSRVAKPVLTHKRQPPRLPTEP